MWKRISAALLRGLAHARCDDAALHEMMLATAQASEVDMWPAVTHQGTLRKAA